MNTHVPEWGKWPGSGGNVLAQAHLYSRRWAAASQCGTCFLSPPPDQACRASGTLGSQGRLRELRVCMMGTVFSFQVFACTDVLQFKRNKVAMFLSLMWLLALWLLLNMSPASIESISFDFGFFSFFFFNYLCFLKIVVEKTQTHHITWKGLLLFSEGRKSGVWYLIRNV